MEKEKGKEKVEEKMIKEQDEQGEMGKRVSLFTGERK